MAETDTVLKLMVAGFPEDFVGWVMGEKTVVSVQLADTALAGSALPASARRSDAVFQVTLADGTETLLHVEFQGAGSRREMPMRMLDY